MVIRGVDNCVYTFKVADITAYCYFISSSSGCDSGSIYLMYNVEYRFVWRAPFVSFLLLAQHIVTQQKSCFSCVSDLCSVSFSVCTLHFSHL